MVNWCSKKCLQNNDESHWLIIKCSTFYIWSPNKIVNNILTKKMIYMQIAGFIYTAVLLQHIIQKNLISEYF